MALIKCDECGENVSDKAKSCPNCGAPVSTFATDKPPAELPENEIHRQKEFNPWDVTGEYVIIDKVRASYFKSAINVDWGRAYLTNFRIVFCGESGNLMKLAAVPVFAVMTASAFPKIHLQILLKDILSVEEKRYGFSKKTVFNTTDGKRYSLQLDDSASWKARLAEFGIIWP